MGILLTEAEERLVGEHCEGDANKHILGVIKNLLDKKLKEDSVEFKTTRDPLECDKYPEKPCPVCGSYEPDVVCFLCEEVECEACKDESEWALVTKGDEKERVHKDCWDVESIQQRLGGNYDR